MNYADIINAIAAGTHRVRTYRIARHRTRYVLEKLNAKHGWLTVEAHGNTLRLAVRNLPHRYDMILGVVYDTADIGNYREG
jgi:hypothetical protein